MAFILFMSMKRMWLSFFYIFFLTMFICAALSPVRNDSFLAVFLNCWIGKENMFYSQRENEKVAAAGLATVLPGS